MANPFGNSQQSFTVQPASPPSMSGTTATQQAYGTAPSTGPRTAAYGSVLAGVVGLVVLGVIYHSLPR